MPRRATETVDVDIVGRIQTDVSVDFETETTILVTTGFIRCQRPQQLRSADGAVDIVAIGKRILKLAHDRHIAVVAEFIKQQASPATANAAASAIAVGVKDHFSERRQARAHAVVAEVRQDDRMSDTADHLHCAADAIMDVKRRSGRGQSGGTAGKFHHQTFRVTALQTQSAEGVVIADNNLVLQDMHDVRVVPDRLGRQHFSADQHAVGAVTLQPIQTHHRAVVVRQLRERIDPAGAAS